MQQLARAFYVIALTFGAQGVADLLAQDDSADFKVETVLSGLDNPWGVVLRAGRDTSGPHELLIAESGAGRVIRVSTIEPNKIEEAIIGFPVQPLASAPTVRAGPLGMAMLTRTKLIVTGGRSVGEDDSEPEVRVYVLPGDESRLAYEQLDHSVSLTPSDASSQIATSNLSGIAKGETAAYITAASAAGEGWILKANIEANQLETLRPFISHEGASKLAAPGGITFTPSDRPQFLVVADQGSLEADRDSRLLFFTLSDGQSALRLDTGLYDITGLAYSPSGQLYAVDCSWHDPGQGGVYRLDDARQEGRQICRPLKIASVTGGVALAFAPDGALYVTALGTGENKKKGSVLKITGDF